MSRLVSELLSLTHLQNGLNTLEMQPTNLGELLSQLMLAMQPQAATAGVDFRLQKSGEDTSSADIGAYLKQWEKAQECDGFVLRKPGRWKYFRVCRIFEKLSKPRLQTDGN